MNRGAKIELGTKLNFAIRMRNVHAVMQTLAQIDVLDDPDICVNGRPLAGACLVGDLRMADILIAKGASPNYLCHGRLPVIWLSDNKPAVRLFLLRKGAWVPRELLVRPGPLADYVFRNWNPGNHHDWPDDVRKDLRELLLVARCKRPNPIRSLGQDPLFYLFRWVATDRFRLLG